MRGFVIAVQDIRVEVDTIGPRDGSRKRVDVDAGKELRVA